MNRTLPLLFALAGAPLLADETRQLEAHVHGVGALDIAMDGATVAMEFHAPGADIVGFEYEATSAEDRDAIEDALGTLARPMDLFQWPSGAACTVTEASAKLEAESDHGEHEHEDHAHDEGHAHGDHDHEEHADHEAHGDEDTHAAHGEHEDHGKEASHTEFHAEYLFTCADPTALTGLELPYFNLFPNALELDIRVITASGAQAFEVQRDAPSLDLRSLF